MNRKEFFSSLRRPAKYIVQELDNYYHIPSRKRQEYETIRETSLPKKYAIKQNKIKKLNILLLTFWKYPHTGGLSNYITSFKEGFEVLGHKVDVISPNSFSDKKRKSLKRQYVKEFEGFLHKRYGEASEQIVKNMRSLYVYETLLSKKNLDKYDIFHAQDLFTAIVIGRLNEFYQKPVFFTPHGIFTNSRIKFGMIKSNSVEEVYFRCLEKQAIKHVAKTIMISHSFRNALRDYGALEENLVTAHSGINMKIVQKKSKRSKLIITSISRLNPRKGHADLLKALTFIKPHLDHVEVRIVGDGEIRKKLERSAKKKELSMVRFFGKRDDVPELLSESDIFILPTLNDNLPISLIEAMFGEQAILTTTCGGIPEIIHHMKTGLLIKPGQPKAIASHLLMLIQEPDIRKRLAKNAKAYACEHLTSEAMVKKILSEYMQVSHKRGEK